MSDHGPLKFKNEDLTPDQLTNYKKFFFVLVLAIVLVTVLGPAVMPLSKEEVRAALDGFSRQLAAAKGETLREARFTYGEVEIGAGHKALVSDPSFALTHGGPLGGSTLILSSPQAVFAPSALAAGDFYLEFPAPIKLSESAKPASALTPADGQPLYTLTFTGGQPVYAQSQAMEPEGRVLVHTLTLPPHATLTPASGTPEDAVALSYDPNARIWCRTSTSGGTSTSGAEFGHVSLVSAERTVSAGAFSTLTSRHPAEEGKIAFDTVVNLADVGIKTSAGQQGPYSLKLSMNGTRSPQAAEADVTLRELVMQADGFRLSAAGQFSRKADDSLPFGSVEAQVQNFASLRNSHALSPEAKAALVDVANRITGQDSTVLEQFSFTVKREKLGTLMVGQAPLEDLAAAVLSRFVLGAPPPPAPAVPAAPPEDHPSERQDAPAAPPPPI